MVRTAVSLDGTLIGVWLPGLSIVSSVRLTILDLCLSTTDDMFSLCSAVAYCDAGDTLSLWLALEPPTSGPSNELEYDSEQLQARVLLKDIVVVPHHVSVCIFACYMTSLGCLCSQMPSNLLFGSLANDTSPQASQAQHMTLLLCGRPSARASRSTTRSRSRASHARRSSTPLGSIACSCASDSRSALRHASSTLKRTTDGNWCAPAAGVSTEEGALWSRR